jgi:hypothetical protein
LSLDSGWRIFSVLAMVHDALIAGSGLTLMSSCPMGVLPAPPFSMSGDEQPPRLFAGGLFPVAVKKASISACTAVSSPFGIKFGTYSPALFASDSPRFLRRRIVFLCTIVFTSTSQRSYNTRMLLRKVYGLQRLWLSDASQHSRDKRRSKSVGQKGMPEVVNSYGSELIAMENKA